ncbi:MAG: hypothetical protein ACOY3H_04675 [Bacillota bacterium]
MAQCQGEELQLKQKAEGGLVPGLVLLALLSLAGHAIFYSTSPVPKVEGVKTPVWTKPAQVVQTQPVVKEDKEKMDGKVLKLEKTITTPVGNITISEVSLNSTDNPIYGEKFGHVVRGTITLKPEYTELKGMEFVFLKGQEEVTGHSQVSQLNKTGPGQYQFLWAVAADGKTLPTALMLKRMEVPTEQQKFSWQVEWLGWMTNSKDDNGNIELSDQQAQPQTIDGQVWQLKTIDYATGTVILAAKTEGAELEVVAATATNDRGETMTLTPKLEEGQLILPLGRTVFTDNARSIKLELVINKGSLEVNEKLKF